MIPLALPGGGHDNESDDEFKDDTVGIATPSGAEKEKIEFTTIINKIKRY